MCFWKTRMQYWGSAGHVLAPFLFNLYTSDFRYNSESCHIQKYSDDTAVVACVRGGQEKVYRDLVEFFYGWTKNNCLLHLFFLRRLRSFNVCSELGGYSRKEVQQTLSLSLNSELTYSEMGNSEYPVPEQLICVSSINSEYVHPELSACMTIIKSHHQWSPDITSHHDNRK